MRLFSENFWILSKATPLNFLMLWVCRKRLMSLRGLFLGFSALCDFFLKGKLVFSHVSSAEKNCFWVSGKTLSGFFGTVWWMKNFTIGWVFPWILFSLRYNADLGRFRIVLLLLALMGLRCSHKSPVIYCIQSHYVIWWPSQIYWTVEFLHFKFIACVT